MAADTDTRVPLSRGRPWQRDGEPGIPALRDTPDRRNAPPAANPRHWQALITLLATKPDSRFISPAMSRRWLDVPDAGRTLSTSTMKRPALPLSVRANESGVRWGSDDDNVQEFELPCNRTKHTGDLGLTRMLLATPWKAVPCEWKEALPYDESQR